MRTPDERFDAKVVVDASGCWLWASTIHKNGYGSFHMIIDGSYKQVLVHRYAWERVHGPIPADMQIDHLCRVRRCVNPAHLELVTQSINVRRSLDARGRSTHCARGHELSDDNIYVRPSTGQRCCRECRSLQSKVRRGKATNERSAS